MSELGKWLVVFGITIAGVGALLWSGVGKSWVGRLPGDINVEGEKFQLHIPIVTCLVISILLTVLFRIVSR